MHSTGKGCLQVAFCAPAHPCFVSTPLCPPGPVCTLNPPSSSLTVDPGHHPDAAVPAASSASTVVKFGMAASWFRRVAALAASAGCVDANPHLDAPIRDG